MCVLVSLCCECVLRMGSSIVHLLLHDTRSRQGTGERAVLPDVQKVLLRGLYILLSSFMKNKLHDASKNQADFVVFEGTLPIREYHSACETSSSLTRSHSFHPLILTTFDRIAAEDI